MPPKNELAAIAKMIDHTLLKAAATTDQIEQLCTEAHEFGFAAVCVNPINVRLCARLLKSSAVQVCTVVGFPLGASLTQTKVLEAELAVQDGASELDMVLDIGALKSNDLNRVEKDVAAVVRACHDSGAILKVIIETAMLTDNEKIHACQIVQEAEADYVKTSTGFGPGGATVADVALMRSTIGLEMGLKAAGGIRSYQDAREMIAAGATRIGTSSGIQILKEAADRQD